MSKSYIYNMFILNTGLFTEVCPQKNERESLHSTPPQTEQQHIQRSGMTDLKNQFVRDCSFLERLFQLLHAKALRSFRTAFSSQFVLRWSLQARRTSTNGYRKTGGFTEPQVHRVDEAVFPSVPVQVLLFQMPPWKKEDKCLVLKDVQNEVCSVKCCCNI